MSLKGKAYIMGAWEHPTRDAPDKTSAQLHFESARGALADAGLSFDDVDGYFCAGDAPGFGGMSMVDYMGLRNVRHLDSTETGGSSYILHVGHAVQAIAARAPIPKRLMHILEGESLLNDATGLACMRIAVIAATTGVFSLTHAIGNFAWLALAGVASGVLVTLAISTAKGWISKRWGEAYDLYVGAENLFGFAQERPIIASDDPFGNYFDSTLVWGPIFGRNIYVGGRWRIPHRK